MLRKTNPDGKFQRHGRPGFGINKAETLLMTAQHDVVTPNMY
jgi:hypothetical protein